MTLGEVCVHPPLARMPPKRWGSILSSLLCETSQGMRAMEATHVHRVIVYHLTLGPTDGSYIVTKCFVESQGVQIIICYVFIQFPPKI